MNWLHAITSRRRTCEEVPPQQALDGDEDFLLVTWDSCRFDAFAQARTPNLDAFGTARRAWAMGTYTFPSHVAMFHGFLPHAFTPEPFYNRYCQQLWRINHRDVHTQPLVTFPPRTKNIVCGFRDRGYYTMGLAAMSIFDHDRVLRNGFLDFQVTGMSSARKQNEICLSQLKSKSANKPFFAFINYGETHSPFRHGDMEAPCGKVEERFSHARLFNQAGLQSEEWTFDSENFEKHLRCAEFLDQRMGELLEFIRHRGRPTTVIVCGDHGECFGESGLYGHGFYHEKVMEVPLLIFRVNAPPHAPPQCTEPVVN
jgi:membrane-anchored protein YejM (alkaline phosphatase superfamily)